jgi:hypothetical protein
MFSGLTSRSPARNQTFEVEKPPRRRSPAGLLSNVPGAGRSSSNVHQAVHKNKESCRQGHNDAQVDLLVQALQAPPGRPSHIWLPTASKLCEVQLLDQPSPDARLCWKLWTVHTCTWNLATTLYLPGVWRKRSNSNSLKQVRKVWSVRYGTDPILLTPSICT